MRLAIVPVTFSEACQFVAAHHRHHKPPQGHKFSLGVAQGDVLVGVAIVGRPVARLFDNGQTLEVVRSATDGTVGANAALYASAWRAAKAMGYRRLITYTQGNESGKTILAAGFRVVADRPPHAGWNRASRPRQDHGADHIPRTLWEISA